MPSNTPDTAAALAKLPPLCFARLPSTGESIAILRGEPGYHPVATRLTPEQLNAGLTEPPSPEQIEAMLAGSMFGWDVPGADPDRVRASRARPPGDGEALDGLLLPGDVSATRVEAGVVLRDGAGEEIATLPAGYTTHDVAVWLDGYVAGGSWGYAQGEREGLALARRAPALAGRNGDGSPAASSVPAGHASPYPPPVADWGGPDAPFRLEGCVPVRPGASPALDRLWTRAGGHLGLYGWLRVADRRAKADGLGGLCDLPERDWRGFYQGRVPPAEAADVALDEHAAEHGTGSAPASASALAPASAFGRAHPAP